MILQAAMEGGFKVDTYLILSERVHVASSNEWMREKTTSFSGPMADLDLLTTAITLNKNIIMYLGSF